MVIIDVVCADKICYFHSCWFCFLNVVEASKDRMFVTHKS